MHKKKLLVFGVAVTTAVLLLPNALSCPQRYMSQTPHWVTYGEHGNAYYGRSVAGAADFNGDGFGDIVVGAEGANGGDSIPGAAYAFYGSPSGLSTVPAWDMGSPGDGGNNTLSTAGDVNGDGFDDLIVGAPRRGDGGTAYVFFGSPWGLESYAAWTNEGSNEAARFGREVAGAGDVDGDGLDEILIGAPDWGDEDRGRVYLYRGSLNGPVYLTFWSPAGSIPGARLGSAVAGAGDVNGDGFADVIVGAQNYGNGINRQGKTNAYYGGPLGLNLEPDWTVLGGSPGIEFGSEIASAGDINGDGFDDIMVGAHKYSNGEEEEGRVFFYLGSANGLYNFPTWVVESNQAFTHMGYSMASAGDINADGFDDVLIGASSWDNGEANEGRAYLFMGSPWGLNCCPAWCLEGNETEAWFNRVRPAGDVNGDGYGDVLVGSAGINTPEWNAGRATVYLGRPLLLADRFELKHKQ